MKVTRRKFLEYVILGGVFMAGFGFLKNKFSHGKKIENVSVKNFFKRNGKALVSKIKAGENLKESILKSVDLIGGFEKIVEKGDSILLKPNYNSADPPPASSDPEFVKSVIELLYEYGASKVVLGESSGPGPPTREVLEKTGVIEVAQKAGAEVYVFDEREYVEVDVSGKYLKKINVTKDVFEFDKIVYTPCMKTHKYAKFTLSLKLCVGITKKRDRWKLHTRNLEKKIGDLNKVLNPSLILVDARKCFITGGPYHGDVREPNLIMASGDRIAIDVEAIKVIQSFEGSSLKKNPWEYNQIKRAVELNLGAKSEEDYKVLEG